MKSRLAYILADGPYPRVKMRSGRTAGEDGLRAQQGSFISDDTSGALWYAPGTFALSAAEAEKMLSRAIRRAEVRLRNQLRNLSRRDVRVDIEAATLKGAPR